ncbi:MULTISPECIES: dihydrofolate reductase [Gemella]|uniref:dihydrofolate reductase n=1 Tax=Gemella TaxID=1378 RepID=UPI000767EE5A|nr:MULTISPECIES: dihydrofolate reductase [Gemella]AME09373.1 dihydrofolate reductase [Gemella sp. oral taxon 928]AXI27009.1 dihydrofolate reductase [Gemella sp. ND 6198]
MVSLIVAYDKEKGIGNENTIPWRIKNDMSRVKELTTGQTIIMGRKTLESIGRALPNRVNRVLTRNPEILGNYKNIEVFSDDKKILENIKTEKVFIFGGGAIYNKYFDVCDEMFVTEVETVTNTDTKFPDFSLEEWELIEKEDFKKDDDNEFNYSFLHYKRKEGK